MSGVWNNGITSQCLLKTIRKMLPLPSNNSYEPVQQQIFIKPILASPTVRSSKIARFWMEPYLRRHPIGLFYHATLVVGLCAAISTFLLQSCCLCVDCRGELEFVRAIALIKFADAEWYQDLARANHLANMRYEAAGRSRKIERSATMRR